MPAHNFLVNEELVQYMLNHLRLSRVDMKFIENILYKHVSVGTITTNQVELFNKIVKKYARQFSKNNIFITDLEKLNWKSKVIESVPAYTQAHIFIENEKIYFRAPYNRSFLQALKKNPIYTFEWNRESRMYSATYGGIILRDILKLSKEHYNEVNMCPIVNTLVSSIKQYEDVQVWDPTLMYVNGRFLIAGLNEYLNDAINHVSLEPNLNTLAMLVQYGVVIDVSVHDYIESLGIDREKIKFASSHNPQVEIKNIENVLHWLKEFDVDIIVETGSSWRSFVPDNVKLMDMITKHGLKVINLVLDNTIPKIEEHKNPVVFKFNSFIDTFYQPQNVFKIIRFVNSEPITLTK